MVQNNDNHTDVVIRCKARLESLGVSLVGPCGAFQIVKAVAAELAPLGYGVAYKGNTGGNDCGGYSTDIVMQRDGRHWDILKDGGGQNGPQFNLATYKPDDPENPRPGSSDEPFINPGIKWVDARTLGGVPVTGDDGGDGSSGSGGVGEPALVDALKPIYNMVVHLEKLVAYADESAERRYKDLVKRLDEVKALAASASAPQAFTGTVRIPYLGTSDINLTAKK